MRDLKDEGQTVHMTELPKEPETPPVAPPVKTGDETPLLLYAGIAIAALCRCKCPGHRLLQTQKETSVTHNEDSCRQLPHGTACFFSR